MFAQFDHFIHYLPIIGTVMFLQDDWVYLWSLYIFVCRFETIRHLLLRHEEQRQGNICPSAVFCLRHKLICTLGFGSSSARKGCTSSSHLCFSCPTQTRDSGAVGLQCDVMGKCCDCRSLLLVVYHFLLFFVCGKLKCVYNPYKNEHVLI